MIEKNQTLNPNENLEAKLDFFETVPDTIDGCGEYFTIESEKDDSENYIFLSNLSSFAIIKVSGENIFLEKDTIKSKDISKNEYFEIYRGNGYEATLKVKFIEMYDEGGFCKGTLKINNSKKETEYRIKGSSGC
jgi:hypothetical protein